MDEEERNFGGDGSLTIESMFFAALVDRRDFQLRKHLESGLDPNTKNDLGETILHVAVQNQNEPGTKMILEDFNGNVNSLTVNGDTPMHYAGRYGSYYEGEAFFSITIAVLIFFEIGRLFCPDYSENLTYFIDVKIFSRDYVIFS